MKSLRFIIPLAVFGVLVAFLAVGLKLNPREVPSPLIGKPAPAFSLTHLADVNKTLTRDDMKGKVWLLNVWASWCTPCLEEHPHLVALARTKQVQMIGLNYKDTRPNATQWLARHGNPYEASLFDGDGRVGIDFGVYGVPETFVIDQAGVIRFKHVGPVTQEVIEKRIVPLVKELMNG
jgi:cytochrome c biogenesis protein CcmG, thiol:disulfide interchange protein DsbE